MKKRSILKPLIIAGAVLALLLGGGIAVVGLIFPPDKVVALILPQAEKATGRKITLEKARFTFFPRPGITLSGLSVENTTRANFSRVPFLTVEKFTACCLDCIAVQGVSGDHPDRLEKAGAPD